MPSTALFVPEFPTPAIHKIHPSLFHGFLNREIIPTLSSVYFSMVVMIPHGFLSLNLASECSLILLATRLVTGPPITIKFFDFVKSMVTSRQVENLFNV